MRRPRIDQQELNQIRARIPRSGGGPRKPLLVEIEAEVLGRIADDAHEYARTRRLNMKLHRRVQSAEAFVTKVRWSAERKAVGLLVRLRGLRYAFDTLADVALEDTQENEVITMSLQEVAIVIRDLLAQVQHGKPPLDALGKHGVPNRILQRVRAYHREKEL